MIQLLCFGCSDLFANRVEVTSTTINLSGFWSHIIITLCRKSHQLLFQLQTVEAPVHKKKKLSPNEKWHAMWTDGTWEARADEYIELLSKPGGLYNIPQLEAPFPLGRHNIAPLAWSTFSWTVEIGCLFVHPCTCTIYKNA